jgi:hypothetical protein
MKLNITKLLLIFFVINYVSSQLFSVINKKEHNNHKSLFETIDFKNKIQSNAKKNIFDFVNFNQIKEKKFNTNIKSNSNTTLKSLFDADSLNKLFPNSNKQPTPLTTHSPERSLKPDYIQIKTLKQLKEKFAVLMEINSSLKSKISDTKALNKKHETFESNILNSIHKNELNINRYNTDLEAKIGLLKVKLSDKEENLVNLQHSINMKYEKLKNKFEKLKQNLNHTKQTHERNIKQIEENLSLKEFKVWKKIDVDNTIKAEQISAKSLEVGGFKIEYDKILFYNNNAKFVIGTEIIDLKDLLKSLASFNKIENKCGNELSKCKVLTKEEIDFNNKKQEEMLNDIIYLRKEANKLLHSKINQSILLK